MKFRLKPPFIASTGQFDLVQSSPNFNEPQDNILSDKNQKASYRSLKDHELFSPVAGCSATLPSNKKPEFRPFPDKEITKLESIPQENLCHQKESLLDSRKDVIAENTNTETISPDKMANTECKIRNNCSNGDVCAPQQISEIKEKSCETRLSNQKRVGVSAGSIDELEQIELKGGNKGNAHQKIQVRISQDLNFPKYKKSEASEVLIKNAIMNNEFLREGLGDKEVMQAVVDAMYPQQFPDNSYVIREGEIGSHLYVCAEGLIEVYKDSKKVNTLGPGKIFGELALLCNTRRNATIKDILSMLSHKHDVESLLDFIRSHITCRQLRSYPITPCTLWVLDRKVFNQIVKRVGTRRIEEYVKYLRSVPILSKLEDDILKKMTDLLKVNIFTAGTPIVKQGEEGNLFYIITVGTVVVTVKKTDGSEKTVGKLVKGEFFGEHALIAKDKRAATVTAQTRVECLTLDREPFIEFLGGLEEVRKVLKSRVDKLKNVEEKISEYSFIRLEDLEVKGTLGIGGFGRVELVEYKNNRTLTFALKRLKKNHVVVFQQQRNVLHEKTTMLCCQSPFIARLHNTYKDNKYLYFLMEACLGGDVWSLLQKNRFFEEPTAKFISACVVEAFHYLHDRGIVYRDLKPENLLFDAKGYVKLVDFGFAKQLNPTEKTWTFAGTPEYLAPEIVLNKGHDRAVDYWALGVFVYELLVGKPPFRGADEMATYSLILKGIGSTPFPKFLSKPAESLIKKLCKIEPTERLGYQKEGIEGIKCHKWFAGFNWMALEKMEMKAPFQPKLSGPADLSYFEECPKDKEIPPDEFGDWDMEF